MKDNDLTFNWELLNDYLNHVSSNIFNEYDKKCLTSLQKRFLIFNYLVNNYEYDWELYNTKCFSKKGVHPLRSMLRLINENKGLCSSLTPVYKFLLEKENIPSICCYCNMDDYVNQHMVLLVKEEDYWSFDDVSGATIDKEGEKLFGYDLTDALNLKSLQKKMVGVPSIFIDSLYYKLPGIYKDEKMSDDVWLELPSNIKRLSIDSINLVINNNYKK